MTTAVLILVCHCRIAYFAKGGGDAYLFDMQSPNIPESVTRTHINVSNKIDYSIQLVHFALLIASSIYHG